MAKVTLTDLTSLANDTSAVNSINNNFQTVEDYINNNVLSRDTGAEVNTMQNDLDMNSNDLLNVNSADMVSLTLNGVAVTTTLYDATVALIDTNNSWSASQVGSTLVDTSAGGATTLDFTIYQNFILTLTSNITLSNPTTETVGQTGFIVFKQDGTGSRTLTLGSEFLTVGGAAITLTTTANAVDVIPYIVSASNEILLGTPSLDFL